MMVLVNVSFTNIIIFRKGWFVKSMKRDLGVVDAVYPMPVLMVAAYDENGKVNVMNVAWGQIADDDKIILFIGEGKRTWLNILASKAFTVALADEEHMDVADFFGIASGNRINDKFERTGYHAVKSDKVNAPIIEEFPVVMECELLEHLKDEYVSAIVGKIVNVKAEEKVQIVIHIIMSYRRILTKQGIDKLHYNQWFKATGLNKAKTRSKGQ